MDWVVNELKPMIDQKYRTIPFRECTGIGGSSMGGLMAFYTVIHYNQLFSKAACLSPALSLCIHQLQEEMNHQGDNFTRLQELQANVSQSESKLDEKMARWEYLSEWVED